jgi:hypothetical protein
VEIEKPIVLSVLYFDNTIIQRRDLKKEKKDEMLNKGIDDCCWYAHELFSSRPPCEAAYLMNSQILVKPYKHAL